MRPLLCGKVRIILWSVGGKGSSRRLLEMRRAESVVQKKGRGNLTTTCSIETEGFLNSKTAYFFCVLQEHDDNRAWKVQAKTRLQILQSITARKIKITVQKNVWSQTLT